MIVRIQKRDCPYVQVDKRPLEDDRLSFKAKGILAYLLSRPDDWTIRLSDMCNRSTDGKESIQNAMKELRALGYAELRKLRTSNGKVTGSEWVIFEYPEGNRQPVNPVAGGDRQPGKPVVGKNTEKTDLFTDEAVSRVSGKPATGKTESRENPSLTNKDSVLTKICTNTPAKAGSVHQSFIQRWNESYAKVHGREYLFQGGKDGVAVSRLLKTNIPPDTLISIAKRAWVKPDLFNCKQAVTISGFISRFNEIQAELAEKPTVRVATDVRGNVIYPGHPEYPYAT